MPLICIFTKYHLATVDPIRVLLLFFLVDENYEFITIMDWIGYDDATIGVLNEFKSKIKYFFILRSNLSILFELCADYMNEHFISFQWTLELLEFC